VSASVTVTAEAWHVGCPTGAGDSEPLGPTGVAVGVGLVVGEGGTVGSAEGDAVGDGVGVGVSTALGVEEDEHATAERAVARVTTRVRVRT
jgi:hypothetical protein